MGSDEFKSYVLGLVSTANDTDARKKFINSINKQRNKDGLIMLVSNAWLRGQGLGANVNDKFAK